MSSDSISEARTRRATESRRPRRRRCRRAVLFFSLAPRWRRIHEASDGNDDSAMGAGSSGHLRRGAGSVRSDRRSIALCRSETPHTSLRWLVWRKRAGHAGGRDVSLYRSIATAIGTREALDLAHRLVAWHDAMVMHRRRAGDSPARRVTLIVRTSRPNRCGWKPSMCTANGRGSSRFSEPWLGPRVISENVSLAELRV